MLLYILDLAGVAVFAASGVLASRDRDLLLDRHLILCCTCRSSASPSQTRC